MRRKLGKLTLTVWQDGDSVLVERETELSEALSVMQAAMTEEEKRRAFAMRSEACRQVGAFFSFVANPDKDVEVVPDPSPS